MHSLWSLINEKIDPNVRYRKEIIGLIVIPESDVADLGGFGGPIWNLIHGTFLLRVKASENKEKTALKIKFSLQTLT